MGSTAKLTQAKMPELKTAGIFVFIYILLLHGFVASFNCTSPTPESLHQALERELLLRRSYRPVQKFSDVMNISVSIIVAGILGVNEKDQSLTTFLWVVQEWDIEGLSWDEKECGTNRVSILREKLWYPDIHITEFMDEDKSPITPYVYLYNTGHVYDDKPLRVMSTCKLGIYNFPFDIQNCSLTFGSYIHFAENMRMVQGNSAADILKDSLNVAQTKGEWQLVDIEIASSSVVISDGEYMDIKYSIILKRQPMLYVINLILPSAFLVVLDVFSLCLPPRSVDRAAFKMTLILGYTVFLLLMNDLLPVTGNETPLLNVFFCLSFALMVASLLETVFITNVHFNSGLYTAPPRWLSVLMLRFLAVVVGLPPKKANRVTVSLPEPGRAMTASIMPSRDLQVNSPAVKPPVDPIMEELRRLSRELFAIRLLADIQFQGSKASQEWKMIALVIDRLLFGLYVIFVIVEFTTFILIWHWSSF